MSGLLLRGGALAVKFLFIIWLARVADLGVLGAYGVAVATLSILTFVSAFELHTVSAAVLHRVSSKASLVAANLGLVVGSSLVIGFGGLLVVYERWSGATFALLFLILLITEVFYAEVQRLMVYLGYIMRANIVNALRMTAFPVLTVMYYYAFDVPEAELTLELLLAVWVCSQAVVFVGILPLRATYVFDVSLKKMIRYGRYYIFRVKFVLAFFLSALSVRAMMGGDRIILNQLAGDQEVVGIYVFFANLAAASLSFFDASILSRRVRSFLKADAGVTVRVSGLVCESVVFFAVFAGCAYFSLPFLLNIVGKDAFSDHGYSLYWLILGHFFLALSMPFHYMLIGRGKPISALVASLLAVVMFLITVFLGFYMFGSEIPSVVGGFVVGCLVLFVAKLSGVKSRVCNEKVRAR